MNPPLRTYYPYLENTNDFLIQQIPHLSSGVAIYTLHQGKGRGTRQRKWEEEEGKNLAFSLYVPFSTLQISPVPLVVGLGVRRTLQLFEISTGLKWSNDIFARGKKLCGILCENRVIDGVSHLVIGIGINLYQIENSPLERISLEELTAKVPNVEELVEALQWEVLSLLRELQEHGFSKQLREEYEAHCIHMGQEILIEIPSTAEQKEAIALGVTKEGALCCRVGEKIVAFHSGRVSLRNIEQKTL